MVENRVRSVWSCGQAALNGWLSIPDPFVAEIMSCHEFDSLTIDMQHGLIDYTDLVPMLQAMHSSNVTPFARVPWLDPAIIMRVLDAGVRGVICPMINNRKQADAFVSYCRYPPQGTRSFGPIRSIVAFGADYYDRANEDVLAFAMVETAEGYANLDAIAATPGLDGIYVGPSDLTLGLTKGQAAPALDREEPVMIDAIRTIQKACAGAGIRAGLHTGSAGYAIRAVSWNFDLVTLNSDTKLLDTAAAEHIGDVRSRLKNSSTASAADQD
ncbi:MAG: aldolase/citrate lyase family protein [Rhodobacteraceae bacterium]|nr:aldolase/citrate lyase family protein [Paracoccaceae bacterium]